MARSSGQADQRRTGAHGAGGGDFNGDGKQDLAVISLEGTGILLGKGDGTFQPLVNIRDAFGNALAVGDFNGDGNLDLVVGDNQFGTLDLLLGNGNGTFQPMVSLPPATNAVTLAVADLNGDGNVDLVVATGSDGEIVTILGNGNGSFRLAKHVLRSRSYGPGNRRLQRRRQNGRSLRHPCECHG